MVRPRVPVVWTTRESFFADQVKTSITRAAFSFNFSFVALCRAICFFHSWRSSVPTYKIDFIFDGERCGWIETWYKEATGIDVVMANAGTLALVRVAMLSKANKLSWIRASDVTVTHDSSVRSTRDSFGQKTNAKPDTNAPWSGWLTRWYGTPQMWRHLVVRGAPQGMVADGPDGLPIPTAAFLEWFSSYRSAILQNGWLINAQDHVAENTNKKQAENVTRAENGRYLISATGHGLTTFDEVKITGKAKKQFKCINGTWTVFVIDANSFEIGQEAPATLPPYLGGIYFTRRIKGFFTLTKGEWVNYSKRDTGRPLFLRAGRRVRKACDV